MMGTAPLKTSLPALLKLVANRCSVQVGSAASKSGGLLLAGTTRHTRMSARRPVVLNSSLAQLQCTSRVRTSSQPRKVMGRAGRTVSTASPRSAIRASLTAECPSPQPGNAYAGHVSTWCTRVMWHTAHTTASNLCLRASAAPAASAAVAVMTPCLCHIRLLNTSLAACCRYTTTSAWLALALTDIGASWSARWGKGRHRGAMGTSNGCWTTGCWLVDALASVSPARSALPSTAAASPDRPAHCSSSSRVAGATTRPRALSSATSALAWLGGVRVVVAVVVVGWPGRSQGEGSPPPPAVGAAPRPDRAARSCASRTDMA
mmetsp:Transcript_14351/g.35565  ORF Transcript_14351/g.35565 Transcript_14351/m.35565 type:complete len:319 (+) Transcript_14351:854-1810(+)